MKKFVLLLVMVVILVGCTKKEENKYILSDYLELEQVQATFLLNDVPVSAEKWKVEISDILFKGLEKSLVSKFMDNHSIFLEDYKEIDVSALNGESDFLNISNDITFSISGELLSVLEESENSSSTYSLYSPLLQSIVIDLKDMSVIASDSLLDTNGLDLRELYALILEDSVKHITVKSLIQSPIGDVTADTLSIEKFKENIQDYAKTLSDTKGINFSAINFNDLQSEYIIGDVISLYYSNNKLRVAYKISPILSSIGLSTHMGMGIDQNIQHFDLSK